MSSFIVSPKSFHEKVRTIIIEEINSWISSFALSAKSSYKGTDEEFSVACENLRSLVEAHFLENIAKFELYCNKNISSEGAVSAELNRLRGEHEVLLQKRNELLEQQSVALHGASLSADIKEQFKKILNEHGGIEFLLHQIKMQVEQLKNLRNLSSGANELAKAISTNLNAVPKDDLVAGIQVGSASEIAGIGLQ